MPKPMETDPNTAVDLADLLAAQAIALDRLFMRAFGDILSGNTRSLRDVSRALKAQAQSRTALRLLRALRAAEPKKSRNRTNGLLNEENPLHDQSLRQGHSERDPLQALPQKVGVVARAPGQTGGAHPRLTTLEKVERPEDGRGQGPLGRERAQARLPKPRFHRAGPRGAEAHIRRRPYHRAGQSPPPGYRHRGDYLLDSRPVGCAASHSFLPWTGSVGSYEAQRSAIRAGIRPAS